MFAGREIDGRDGSENGQLRKLGTDHIVACRVCRKLDVRRDWSWKEGLVGAARDRPRFKGCMEGGEPLKRVGRVR